MWSTNHTGEKHEKCQQRDTAEAGPASPVQLVLLISSAGRFALRVTAPSVRSRAVKSVFSKFSSSCSELEEAKRGQSEQKVRFTVTPQTLILPEQTAELHTCCSGTEDVCWPASGRAHAAPPPASPWRRRPVCRTKLSPCKRRPTITDLSLQPFYCSRQEGAARSAETLMWSWQRKITWCPSSFVGRPSSPW